MANSVKNSNMVVGLDIGTSKVVCIVGKYNNDKKLEIVALGSYPSSGLKKGVVVNIDATTDAISKAVEQAREEHEDVLNLGDVTNVTEIPQVFRSVGSVIVSNGPELFEDFLTGGGGGTIVVV